MSTPLDIVCLGEPMVEFTRIDDPDDRQHSKMPLAYFHESRGTYHFYRERALQAAARRLRRLPGPKHTAEEYMLLYFLETRSLTS